MALIFNEALILIKDILSDIIIFDLEDAVATANLKTKAKKQRLIIQAIVLVSD
ncbi:MAG UNVERIFIED_CONTAM: hypothetical protein LVQ98_06690 [Rickettsiaceae bacterium]|jgi:citrate lyase beta subunit